MTPSLVRNDFRKKYIVIPPQFTRTARGMGGQYYTAPTTVTVDGVVNGMPTKMATLDSYMSNALAGDLSNPNGFSIKGYNGGWTQESDIVNGYRQAAINYCRVYQQACTEDPATVADRYSSKLISILKTIPLDTSGRTASGSVYDNLFKLDFNSNTGTVQNPGPAITTAPVYTPYVTPVTSPAPASTTSTPTTQQSTATQSSSGSTSQTTQTTGTTTNTDPGTIPPGTTNVQTPVSTSDSITGGITDFIDSTVEILGVQIPIWLLGLGAIGAFMAFDSKGGRR